MGRTHSPRETPSSRGLLPTGFVHQEKKKILIFLLLGCPNTQVVCSSCSCLSRSEVSLVDFSSFNWSFFILHVGSRMSQLRVPVVIFFVRVVVCRLVWTQPNVTNQPSVKVFVMGNNYLTIIDYRHSLRRLLRLSL